MSGRRRVWIATSDALTPRMAGPAIRGWQMATALAASCDVRLTTSSVCRDVTGAGFTVGPLEGAAAARALAEWCEVLVFQGSLLDDHPWLCDVDRVVVADLYDPFHLEQVEQTRDLEPTTRRRIARAGVASVDRQLLRADLVLCASDRQRDFWVGHLAALGRVNPATYDEDPTLRSLVVTVPFGLPAEPPVRSRPRLKGVVPGIDADDSVLLWGGGVYNWFDPVTLVRAVDVIRRDVPRVRLFFLGMVHPHPDVAEMRAAAETRALAERLGMVGRQVFFNEQWVRYDERADYLLDADLGVSTHHEHLETAYAFRTRMLDYLWAGLPIVCTRGDTFADLVERRGLGRAVPAGDVAALAAALRGLLTDPAERAAVRGRVAALAPDYAWPLVLAPLLDFAAAPRRAPDLLDPVLGRQLRRARRSRTPASGWRAEVGIAAEHLREGGLRRVSEKAVSRLRHVAGRSAAPDRSATG